MKILFVVNDVFFSENLGPMTLSAICKQAGHQTRLLVLRRHNIRQVLDDFLPDLLGYSAMTPDLAAFQRADAVIQAWSAEHCHPLVRILGGAHATFFPEVGQSFDLDAVVVGEGDHAIMNIVNALEAGGGLGGIPNVIPRGGRLEDMAREIVQDLDALPFLDRDIFYEAAPHLRYFRLRSVKVGRGCPYRCTYCHNHIFNKTFQGAGRIIRRRSVDSVIAELKYVVQNYGPVAQIRFGDDTFFYKVDDWARELLGRYKREIGLPFYCLLRSNVITEEMVCLLAESGCCSTGLSVESGNPDLRNRVLKRGISDEVVVRSFRLLRQYGISTQTNSMLALPGGTLADDLLSFSFERSLKPSVGQFSIWTPFPRTELTEYAQDLGVLSRDYDFLNYFGDKSALSSFTDKEKTAQVNIVTLGTLFCDLPDFCLPLFHRLIRMQTNKVFSLVGGAYVLIKYFLFMFYRAVPKNPVAMMRFLLASISYLKGK